MKAGIERLDQNTLIAPVGILIIGTAREHQVRIRSGKLSLPAPHLALRQEKINKFIHCDPDSQIPQKHYRAQAFVTGRPFGRPLHMRNFQYVSQSSPPPLCFLQMFFIICIDLVISVIIDVVFDPAGFFCCGLFVNTDRNQYFLQQFVS